MAKVKKGKCKKTRWKTKAAIWLLGLVAGVPMLINWCYSLPFIWFRTQWGAAEVLDYYASLLGTAVAGLAILASVGLFLQEQKNQNDIQRIQETEKAIDQTLDVLNPKRIKFMILELPEKNKHPNYADFQEEVYFFQQEITVAVDRLTRSIYRTKSRRIEKLITSIEDLKKEIDTEIDDYVKKVTEHLKKIRGIQEEGDPQKQKRNTVDLYFADVLNFQDVQNTLYTDFLNLTKKKTETFDQEYADVSDRISDLFLKRFFAKIYMLNGEE